jgi:transcriptional regulator GlxA family with amidase domain
MLIRSDCTRLLDVVANQFAASPTVKIKRHPQHLATARWYVHLVTPEELANLAHLRRARDLMDREYARPLDVAALARAALMSTAHFSRQFRAAYGETPYAYLMTRRVERASAWLRRQGSHPPDALSEQDRRSVRGARCLALRT